MTNKFMVSGKHNPCPICDRSKDGDCRISESRELVLCHTHIEGQKGEVINGFAWVGKSEEGAGWGKWVVAKPKNPDYRPQGRRFEFPYQNESGEVTCAKVRVYQKQPDGSVKKKDWWKPQGVDSSLLLPYRHNDAIAALKDDPTLPLFIDESEMTVDELWKRGIPAIAFGRTLKPTRIKELLSGFESRLVICVDRDKPGLEKATKYQKLFPMAATLKPYPGSDFWLPEWLPESGGLDVRDWILEGGLSKEQILGAIAKTNDAPKAARENGKESFDDNWSRRIAKMSEIEQSCGFLTSKYISHLEDLAKEEKLSPKSLQGIYGTYLSEEAEEEDRTIAEMVAATPEDIPWLIPGILPSGITLLLHARSGCGKTLLAYNLIKSLYQGTSFLGHRVTRETKCGLIQIDEPPLALISRAKELGLDKLSIPTKTKWSFGQLHTLADWIKRYQLEFLVLDSFFAGQKYAGTSENDADHAAVLMRLRDIAASTNCTIMVVHHSNKKDEARGTDAIVGAVSDMWHLCKPDPERHGQYKLKPTERVFECQKTRFCEEPFKTAIALEGETLVWSALGDLNKIDNGTANEPASLAERVKLWLDTRTDPFTISQLLEERTMIGLERSNAKKILARHKRNGLCFGEISTDGVSETKWFSLIAQKFKPATTRDNIFQNPETPSQSGFIPATKGGDNTRDIPGTKQNLVAGDKVDACLGYVPGVSRVLSRGGVPPSNADSESVSGIHDSTVPPKTPEFENTKNAIANRIADDNIKKSSEASPHKPSRPYGGPPVDALVQFKDRGLSPAYLRKLAETATDYPWGAMGRVVSIVKNTNRHEIIVSVAEETYLVDNFLAIETIELPGEFKAPPESDDAWEVEEDIEQLEL